MLQYVPVIPYSMPRQNIEMKQDKLTKSKVGCNAAKKLQCIYLIPTRPCSSYTLSRISQQSVSSPHKTGKSNFSLPRVSLLLLHHHYLIYLLTLPSPTSTALSSLLCESTFPQPSSPSFSLSPRYLRSSLRSLRPIPSRKGSRRLLRLRDRLRRHLQRRYLL